MTGPVWPCVAALIFFVGAADIAYGEIERLPVLKGIPPTNGINGTYFVTIKNDVSAEIQFAIREPGAGWLPQSLLPKEKAIYRCNACQGRFEIGLKANGIPTTKEMRAGSYYQIKYNYNTKALDVFEVP